MSITLNDRKWHDSHSGSEIGIMRRQFKWYTISSDGESDDGTNIDESVASHNE